MFHLLIPFSLDPKIRIELRRKKIAKDFQASDQKESL